MSGAAPVLLCMRGVKKSFGAVTALDGVDLEVRQGEVHALIGENGAGKSTLMKVLSGAHAPDAGTMELAGAPFRPRNPSDARGRGVAMIYQELTLAPHLTVEENVMLGREAARCGFLRRRPMRAAVAEALRALDQAEIPPGRKVADLGPGARQMVEVARALVGEARVIVMDEPTSSLSRQDSERLFAVIEKLKERGLAVIYISHFLEEVNRVAGRFTVLRDGRTVGGGALPGVAVAEIIELMVGRKLEEVFPAIPHEPGEVLLRVQGLEGEPLPLAAGFELRRGEILGIAGLVGAGRTEMLRALFGLNQVIAGRITIGGAEDGGAPPRRRLAQGVGLLSESRKEEGLALNLSVAVNATLSCLAPFARLGWLRRTRQARAASRWIERLGIRCRGPWQPVSELSGGNQQKTALARLLHHDVDVLLLDEPTRGIDVGSKTEVYRLMGELAAAGKAILFVSSYVPELLGVCDRIAVMHRGRLLKPRPAREWSDSAILDEAARGAAG
ncbi:MAG: sugar ABC transporter ATP-binding protein [Planctomycetes bacterium]|nr:sugar ABC transporter ATP-binding protein [Planctomycetota bacterium]